MPTCKAWAFIANKRVHTMDINTLRSAVTVVTFILFIGIVVWALSKRRAADFEEAAQLPFGQDD